MAFCGQFNFFNQIKIAVEAYCVGGNAVLGAGCGDLIVLIPVVACCRDISNSVFFAAARALIIVISGGRAGCAYGFNIADIIAVFIQEIIYINAVVVTERRNNAVIVSYGSFNSVNYSGLIRVKRTAVFAYELTVGAGSCAGCLGNADKFKVVAERLFFKLSYKSAGGAHHLINCTVGAGCCAVNIIGIAPDMFMAHILAPDLIGITVYKLCKLISILIFGSVCVFPMVKYIVAS